MYILYKPASPGVVAAAEVKTGEKVVVVVVVVCVCEGGGWRGGGATCPIHRVA